MKPLAIDLYSGLGGWTEGLLAEGYQVVGFDNERHVYGDARYPAQLVIQDVLTIHGKQFKDAALIVASPPCQEFSYRAMPWKRARATVPDVLPQWWSKSIDQMTAEDKRQWDEYARLHPASPPNTALFDACFRIQREAIEAAGHFIPLVVENVRGAQPYVGRSKYHFGSFHLWGDVPALMPIARGRKNAGGSWFAIANNTTSGHGQNPDGRKVPAFRFDGSGKSFQSAAVEHTGIKVPGLDLREATKGVGLGSASWQRKEDSHPLDPRNFYSKSSARKRASAMIAKIPLVLSRWIAAAWYPVDLAERWA